MQIVPSGDNLPEMLKPIIKKNKINVSSVYLLRVL